jgi:hypothetical protein
MSPEKKTPTRAGIGVPSSPMCCSTRRPEHTPTIRELQAAILARRHLLPPNVAQLIAELAFAEAAR